MTWPTVLLLAVGAGVVTALAAILIPDGNSFHEIAVHLEAWVLLAIFIISNCEKPWEAALKTFVFFLISQPLAYLFQVPFSWLGWGIFRYYRYWFFITLLTLPGAFIGWFIKRDDILSGLILSVMLVLLTAQGMSYAGDMVRNFPQHLVSTLFCFGQIPLYIYGILKNKKARVLSLVITIAAAAFFGWSVFASPEMDAVFALSLDRDVYPVDENWSVSTENEDAITAELVDMGDGSYVLRLHLFEKTENTVILTDQDANEYRLKVSYEDDSGLRVTDETGHTW